MDAERRVQRRGFIAVTKRFMLMVFYNPLTKRWSTEEYGVNKTKTSALLRRMRDFRYERRWHLVTKGRFRLIVRMLRMKKWL